MDSISNNKSQPIVPSLDEELKQAQIKRYKLESEKFELEKLKIQRELGRESREQEKPWFRKKETWKTLKTSLTGVAILGFYIKFFLVPMTQIDNINNTLENKRNQERLVEYKQELDYTSKELELIAEELSFKKREFLLERGNWKKRIDSIEASKNQELILSQKKNRLLAKSNSLQKQRFQSIKSSQIQEKRKLDAQISLFSDSIATVTAKIQEIQEKTKINTIALEKYRTSEILHENLKDAARKKVLDFFSTVKLISGKTKSDSSRNQLIISNLTSFAPNASIKFKNDRKKDSEIIRIPIKQYMVQYEKWTGYVQDFELSSDVEKIGSVSCDTGLKTCQLQLVYTQKVLCKRGFIFGSYTTRSKVEIIASPIKVGNFNFWEVKLGNILVTDLGFIAEDIINL